jgi:dihydroorotate dehydrogenase
MHAAVKNRPVFLKVAPDLDDAAISGIAEVVRVQPWLSGLIISNTTTDRPETLGSSFRSETGGLSGAPLLEKSTRVLAAFHSELKDAVDLIGVGGVTTGADIAAKLRAGAQAVQLYSAMVFEGPGIVARLKSELIEIMTANGVVTVGDLTA